MAVQLVFEKRIYIPHPQEAAEGLNKEGDSLFDQDRFEQALECYTAALEILQGLYGENHLDLTTTLYGRATALCKLGRFEEALECYTKALQILQALGAANTPVLALILRTRGTVLFILGRPKEALSDLRDALNIFIQFFDSNHPEVTATQRIIFSIKSAAVVFIFYAYCKILFPDDGNF